MWFWLNSNGIIFSTSSICGLVMELIDGVVDVTLRGEVVESLAQPLLSEAPEGGEEIPAAEADIDRALLDAGEDLPGRRGDVAGAGAEKLVDCRLSLRMTELAGPDTHAGLLQYPGPGEERVVVDVVVGSPARHATISASPRSPGPGGKVSGSWSSEALQGLGLECLERCLGGDRGPGLLPRHAERHRDQLQLVSSHLQLI